MPVTPPTAAPPGGLPLPLGQLLRRAANAKSVADRHTSAWALWEAAIKTLGAAAVGTFAADPSPNPRITAQMRKLARPSLGDWVGLLRDVVPHLADRGAAGFPALRAAVSAKRHDDLPRAAGLSAVLAELRGERPTSRATVSLAELLDHLVDYRNDEVGHGVGGHRAVAVRDRVGRALVAAFEEVFAALDLLAGGRLVYVDECRRDGPAWAVGGLELVWPGPNRVPEWRWPERPDPAGARVYLRTSAGDHLPLHPLVWFEPEAEQTYFLNARRGRARVEYLCYATGEHLDREEFTTNHRDFLASVLGVPVAPAQADQWAAESLAGEPAAHAPAAEVRRLGEFEIEGELGRGGMGIVYRARQPSLDRAVAVKRLFCSGKPEAEKRFAREIRALGHVEHPHLVKVYTSGSDADQWFYAMELVDGVPLSVVCQTLSASSLSPEAVDRAAWQAAVSTACSTDYPPDSESRLPIPSEAAEPTSPTPELPMFPGGSLGYVRLVVALIAQVADAAHALHEAGILHRDIKPGNVMVSPDGERATLMDLGLAKFLDEAGDGVTNTRGFVGTARYASPEQVAAVGGVDWRADVYGLGATLWELLTLRPIHGADRLTEKQLMQRVLRKPADRVRKHHREVPQELDAIVGRCLERDPDARYPTAKAAGRRPAELAERQASSGHDRTSAVADAGRRVGPACSLRLRRWCWGGRGTVRPRRTSDSCRPRSARNPRPPGSTAAGN